MKIYLVGLPGSGKTTLGKKIAEDLALPFIDLDEEIVKKHQIAISEIFEMHGEDYFRQQEADLLRAITKGNQQFLLSTGGGAPCFHNNMEYINSQGISVFLNISYEKIASRIKPDKLEKRPLFKGLTPENAVEELKKKFHHRMEFYTKSKLQFNDDQQNAETIVTELKKLSERPTHS